MTDEELANFTVSSSENAMKVAIDQRMIMEAHLAAGFKRKEVMRLLVAWAGRTMPPPPTDMAALNAIMANMVEGLKE